MLTSLSEQISNPRHVFIQLSSGKLLAHKEDNKGWFSDLEPKPNSFRTGQKVRYTLLAATRTLANGNHLFDGAKLIDCVSGQQIRLEECNGTVT
jgi:hypothetical protein